MPAYLIVYRESPVRDEESMTEYQRRNRESPPTGFDMKPLVVYGAVHALEGQAPDGVVMLQFSTVDEAKAWYNSPEYQASLPLRLRSAEYKTIIVEGI